MKRAGGRDRSCLIGPPLAQPTSPPFVAIVSFVVISSPFAAFAPRKRVLSPRVLSHDVCRETHFWRHNSLVRGGAIGWGTLDRRSPWRLPGLPRSESLRGAAAPSLASHLSFCCLYPLRHKKHDPWEPPACGKKSLRPMLNHATIPNTWTLYLRYLAGVACAPATMPYRVTCIVRE
jgi:hypothetical protein